MRLVSIVGARPQFVKIAPVSRALGNPELTDGVPVEDIIVHTGQHYDHGMSEVFFDELRIPNPTVNLEIGSGPHGQQTGEMMIAIERELESRRPDVVVVYGDTNSTLAGAIAAAKLRIPIAHVEAGLRSFNREMPEEINRIVADQVSDRLLAPTETAMVNLREEGLDSHAVLTGDVMFDAVRFNLELAGESSTILDELQLEPGRYAVATLHRASNTDSQSLPAIVDAFNELAQTTVPIVFPMHPRTTAALQRTYPDWQAADGLTVIKPVGYLDMLALLAGASIALSDSGGLQKEALFVGTPCVTLREETEWPETVDAGGNVLVGADPDRIMEAVPRMMNAADTSSASALGTASSPFGDGRAAEYIVKEILQMC